MRYGINEVQPTDMPSLAFDFHATTPFDFFSAMYFFKARRLFCLLRLCEFFRASCFMVILLVRSQSALELAAQEGGGKQRKRSILSPEIYCTDLRSEFDFSANSTNCMDSTSRGYRGRGRRSASRIP
jgi:hypothetical protein